MKKIGMVLGLFFVLCAKAFANPACAVCTVAIAGSLTLARKLGVDDCIVALWGGAMLAMLGYWAIRFSEKRNWTFTGYKAFWMLLSLSMIAFVYWKDLTYTPNVILGFLYMDYFLFTTLLGAAILIFGVHLYAWIKAKNGGHAHFPFEKVFVPIALLALVNGLMVIYPFCNCDKPAALMVSVDDTPSFD